MGSRYRSVENALQGNQMDRQTKSPTPIKGPTRTADSERVKPLRRLCSRMTQKTMGPQKSPISTMCPGDLRKGCISVPDLDSSHDGSRLDRELLGRLAGLRVGGLIIHTSQQGGALDVHLPVFGDPDLHAPHEYK